MFAKRVLSKACQSFDPERQAKPLVANNLLDLGILLRTRLVCGSSVGGTRRGRWVGFVGGSPRPTRQGAHLQGAHLRTRKKVRAGLVAGFRQLLASGTSCPSPPRPRTVLAQVLAQLQGRRAGPRTPRARNRDQTLRLEQESVLMLAFFLYSNIFLLPKPDIATKIMLFLC